MVDGRSFKTLATYSSILCPPPGHSFLLVLSILALSAMAGQEETTAEPSVQTLQEIQADEGSSSASSLYFRFIRFFFPSATWFSCET